ncbi:MAG: hypothetical protein ACSHX3_16590 [Litorimonas sp.]
MLIKAALEELIRAQACPDGHALRLAQFEDFKTLEAINAQAMHFAGQDVYGLQNKRFFEDVTENGAAIMMILRDGIAQGYSITGAAARMAVIFANEQDRGLMFGTALTADLRGAGWQRRMIALRKKALFNCGFSAAKAFVSPRNLRSLRNLLAEGCRVISHDSTYYGCDRFIVEVQENPVNFKSSQTRRVHLGADKDLSPHIALLAKGWNGVSLEDTGGDVFMVYHQVD